MSNKLYGYKPISFMTIILVEKIGFVNRKHTKIKKKEVKNYDQGSNCENRRQAGSHL